MSRLDDQGRVQLSPEDVGNTDREKRGYTKSTDEGADASEVETTLRYRYWIEGEVMIEVHPLEKRLACDALSKSAEALGLFCRRQFIPADADPRYFPRKPTKTSPRRYTLHEFVIYLMHYPGTTMEDLARGMFPETQYTKAVLPRVRQMLRKLESMHRIQREKCRVTGKWRFYPATSRSISGTIVSRSMAQAIAGILHVPVEDILQAVDDTLKRIAAHKDLLPTPNHPAWREIMDPANLAPGAEEPLVVQNPSTGMIPDGTDLDLPPRKLMPKRPDLTVAEYNAQLSPDRLEGDPF